VKRASLIGWCRTFRGVVSASLTITITPTRVLSGKIFFMSTFKKKFDIRSILLAIALSSSICFFLTSIYFLITADLSILFEVGPTTNLIRGYVEDFSFFAAFFILPWFILNIFFSILIVLKRNTYENKLATLIVTIALVLLLSIVIFFLSILILLFLDSHFL